MLPDGIRKASTRKVRSRSQTTSATRMDLAHSQSAWLTWAVRVLVSSVMVSRTQWSTGSRAHSTQSAMKRLVSPGFC